MQPNLDFFARVDRALSRRLTPADPARHQVIKTATGELNIVRQEPDGAGCPLYTSSNPKRAARRAIAGISPGQVEAVIILGTGLGYHLQALAEHLPPRTMFIILEENGDLFRVALRHIDFKRLLSPRPWSLLIGNDLHHLVPILVNLIESGTGSFTCCVIPPFNRICAFAPYLAAHIKQASIIVEFNRRTRSRLRRRWTRNCIRNLRTLPDSRPLGSLAAKFRQVPASIICAGPSLDQHLPHLPRLLERTLTLCTDSALPVLTKMNLKPHFVVTMDPFAPAADAGMERPLARNGLICPLTASPEAIVSMGSERYFSRYQDVKLWPNISRLCRSLPRLPVSGSVSLYAYQAARFLGAEPIIFVGQDLSFPAFKAYSRGTRQADRLLGRADRFHSLERLNLDNVLDRRPVFTATSGGGQIPTTKTLLQYRIGLQAMWADEPERAINCTAGGIMGGNTADLETVIEPLAAVKPQLESLWDTLYRELEQRGPAVDNQRLESALHPIREVLEQLVEDNEWDRLEQAPLPPFLAPFGDVIHDIYQQTNSLPEAMAETAKLVATALQS